MCPRCQEYVKIRFDPDRQTRKTRKRKQVKKMKTIYYFTLGCLFFIKTIQLG